MAALEAWIQEPGYSAYRDVIQELTEQVAVGTLKATTADEANFVRGQLYAFRVMYDVCDRIIAAKDVYLKREKTLRDRTAANGDAASNEHRHWGSTFFTDFASNT